MSKTKTPTRLQIVKEVTDFYSAHPELRGLTSDGKCVYQTEDGRKCAVGRYLLSSVIFMGPLADTPENKINSGGGSVGYLKGPDESSFEVSPTLDSRLRKKYRGHTPIFWSDLQQFHDTADYWSEGAGGLTEDGHEYVATLLKRYAEQ